MGWGSEDVAFTHQDKPDLGPFLRRHFEIVVDRLSASRVAFGDLSIPEPTVASGLLAASESAVGAEHVSTDPLDRRHRRRSPHARLPVISFGGGSNISGSLEPPEADPRTIVSVDLGRMAPGAGIDETARLARAQPGVFGPELEDQLNARGWTLGHFPDSFAHSTLGGWIATRSSGMQSGVVTPAGVLATRPVPATSTGPSVGEMILGSEGRLGIISEATVHVHRAPVRRAILGYDGVDPGANLNPAKVI